MRHKNYARGFEPIEPPIVTPRAKPITDWQELEDVMRGGLNFNALSEDQVKVFDHVIKWYEGSIGSSDLLTLGGFAGTGKSTLTSIIAKELENAGEKDFSIAFCAFTGKAANGLRQKLRKAGVDCSLVRAGLPSGADTRARGVRRIPRARSPSRAISRRSSSAPRHPA